MAKKISDRNTKAEILEAYQELHMTLETASEVEEIE